MYGIFGNLEFDLGRQLRFLQGRDFWNTGVRAQTRSQVGCAKKCYLSGMTLPQHLLHVGSEDVELERNDKTEGRSHGPETE